MKKIIFLILFFVIFNQVNVLAATSDDVLSKYGINIRTVDIESLKSRLQVSFDNYNELSDDYYKTTYLKNAEKLIKANNKSRLSSLSAESCVLELNRLSDCLVAMVNIDADFDELYDIEEQYREKSKELNEIMLLKAAYSTDVIPYSMNTRGVSINDVLSASKEIDSLKRQINNAVVKENIGELKSLKSPTQGIFNKTSGFGNRINPITGSGTEKHTGLDLAAPKDTPVLSLFKGKVISAEYSNSLGNYVIVSHSKELQTLYAHMNSLNVKKGDLVEQYAVIGAVGTTGSSTGNHLHLGVYINGIKMDPEILFKQ